MEAQSTNDGGVKYLWSVAALATIAGIGVVGIGVMGELRDWWHAVWSTVLIDGGVALALVATITYLEQRMFRREADALEQRVQDQQRQLSDRIDELSTTIGDINARAEERRKARYQAQDDAIRQLDVALTPENVFRAMSAAEESGAIGHRLSVQASANQHGLRMVFSILSGQISGSQTIDAFLYSPGSGPMDSPTHPYFMNHHAHEVTWKPDQPAEEFIDGFVKSLEHAKEFWPGLIDAETLFSNLRRSLDVVIRAHRSEGPSGLTLRGPLFEMYNEDWYITATALECPSHGYTLPIKTILDLMAENAPPESPSFIALDDWRFLIEFISEAFYRHPMPTR